MTKQISLKERIEELRKNYEHSVKSSILEAPTKTFDDRYMWKIIKELEEIIEIQKDFINHAIDLNWCNVSDGGKYFDKKAKETLAKTQQLLNGGGNENN